MEKARRSQRRKTITLGAKNRKCLGRPEEMQRSGRAKSKLAIKSASQKIKVSAKKQLEKVKKVQTKTPKHDTIDSSMGSNSPKVESTQVEMNSQFLESPIKSVAPEKSGNPESPQSEKRDTKESDKNSDSTGASEPRGKLKLRWYEFTLLGVIGVSGVAIAIAAVVGLSFDPWQSVEKEMDAITKEYYISYLYPRLTDDDSGESLEAYQETGVPTTYLRQLLSFDDAKFAKSAKVFSNDYYVCDTNSTGVRYYPYAPYGPEDYRAEYYWSCQDSSEL